MKKVLALGLIAVSTVTLLASCSSSTKDNLNSRPFNRTIGDISIPTVSDSNK